MIKSLLIVATLGFTVGACGNQNAASSSVKGSCGQYQGYVAGIPETRFYVVGGTCSNPAAKTAALVNCRKYLNDNFGKNVGKCMYFPPAN